MYKSKHSLKKMVCALGVSTILAGMPIVGHAWEPQKPVEFSISMKGSGKDGVSRRTNSFCLLMRRPVSRPGLASAPHSLRSPDRP